MTKETFFRNLLRLAESENSKFPDGFCGVYFYLGYGYARACTCEAFARSESNELNANEIVSFIDANKGRVEDTGFTDLDCAFRNGVEFYRRAVNRVYELYR